MTTLVCFHAHPDDEAIGTGGVMAKAAADGHRVVLVCATRGEQGEPVPGVLNEGEQLWERRVVETHASAQVLGADRVEFLGYEDSGMMGEPTNDNPACFWQADIEEAAERLAAILRDVDAGVLTIYDDHGGYGHPDHINVHRVGRRAAELVELDEVYQGTMNRTRIAEMIEANRNSEEPNPDLPADDQDFDTESFGTVEADITHAVDVSAFITKKKQSMEAHASQISEESFFMKMPDEIFALAFGTEWFIKLDAKRDEGEPFGDDLFAGITDRIDRADRADPGRRMTLLYLVRHGHAAAGYGDDPDPGLDDLGRRQAEAMADELEALGPLPIITSPLLRARETAAALERRWNTMAVVDPSVAEIPSPSDDLHERHEWLQQAMGGTWADLGPRYTSWRTMVTELLLQFRHDTVIVSHFVAINAAIGRATGDDRLMCAPVGNASITVMEHDGKVLRVVERGDDDPTSTVL